MERKTDDKELGLPRKLRGLPRELSRLIVEQPPCWEYLLFGEALAHEIAALTDLRRDLEYGITSGAVVDMTPKAFLASWIPRKLDEARGFGVAIEQIMKRALPEALGPEGQAGDPEAILYCAKKLAGVYRNATKWRLEFMRVSVPAELSVLKSLVLRFQVASQIEEFALRFNRELKQAVLDMEAGKAVTVNLRGASGFLVDGGPGWLAGGPVPTGDSP